MIDFATPITDYDGVPVKMGDKEMTLRDVSVMALVQGYDDERGLSGQERFERGRLAGAIHDAKEPMQLKSEEITLLKKVVGKAFTPMVVFRAYPLIDAAEKPAA